jgi:hypothetical protein
MKKQLSLIAALVLASSAFTACGKSSGKGDGEESDKSGYKKALSGIISATIDSDPEKMYSYMYPKEIVELHDELGDFEIDEDDEEYVEKLKQCTYKVTKTEEEEAMSASQLKFAEKWLADEKFQLECKIEDEDDWYDTYYDGRDDVEPFCEVTKGYKLNVEMELSYPKDLYGDYDYDDEDEDEDDDSSSKKKGSKKSSKSSKDDMETTTREEELYVYFVKGEGWKVDFYNGLEYYLDSHSTAAMINDKIYEFLDEAGLSYSSGYFIVGSDDDHTYNVPDDLDVDDFRDYIKENVEEADGLEYFVVCSYYSARYVATSENGKDWESTYPSKSYIEYDDEYEYITTMYFEDEDEDEEFSYSDIYDKAVDAVDEYNDEYDY